MAANTAATKDPIDLQGWDTANVISYSKMNRAIAKSNSTPKDFDFTDDTEWEIQGKWSPWELTLGGDGQNIYMKCTVESGTIKSPFGKDLDLKGVWLTIEVRLAKKAGDASAKDPTGTGGKPQAFVVNDQPPTEDTLAVSVIESSIDHNEKLKIWRNDLDGTFKSYFNKHILDFVQVFNTVLIDSKADKEGFQWIKPTEVTYAVSEPVGGTLDTAVFAILAQTENRSAEGLAQQIDVRVIENLPSDTNSVFAVSGPRLVDQLLLPGSVKTITGSATKDFDIDYKGLSLTNNKELSWRKTELHDGAATYTVEQMIPKNGFRMSVEGDTIELEFTGVYFDAPQWKMPGNLLVKTTFTQVLFLKTHTQKDGSTVLIPSDFDPSIKDPPKGLNLKRYSVAIEPDKTAKTFEAWMQGISIALAAIGVVAVAGKGISKIVSKAAQAAATAAEASAALTAADVTASLEDVYSDVESLMNALNRANKLVPIAARANLALNKIMLGSFLVGLPFAGVTASEKIIEMMTRGSIEDGTGLPSIDHFAANCLGASQWPALKEWKLNNVRLNNCLMLQGDFKEAD